MRHLVLAPILAAALGAAPPASVATAREGGERPPGAEPRVQPHERRGEGRPQHGWEREAERRVVPRERPEPPGAHSAPPHHRAGTSGPVVHRLPAQPQRTVHGGQPYWFAGGTWYARHPSGGYVVVSPPLGAVVTELPVFRSIVRIGGTTLYLVGDAYYRPLAQGGYQVVAPPQPQWGGPATRPTLLPRRSQGPEQQARDEYECHRWAVAQSGHDPTAYAASANLRQVQDYRRAQAACLEAQGYLLR